MTKQEIINTALKTAEWNQNFKGKMLCTADGNTFLWRDSGSLNAAVNHVRATKKNGEEQLLYVVDNTGNKPTCEAYKSEDLLTQSPQPVQDVTDKLKVKEGEPVDYASKTNAELKALCEERGIDVSAAKKKQDFIDLLIADDATKTEEGK